MKQFKLSETGDRGWFVGHFERAVYKTSLFEAAVQTFKKDEVSARHTHKIATEINLVMQGKVMYGDKLLGPGDGIIYEPGDVCQCRYLEDTMTFVIKTPSVADDKYLLGNEIDVGMVFKHP